jgi:hypothetical protein
MGQIYHISYKKYNSEQNIIIYFIDKNTNILFLNEKSLNVTEKY